MQKRKTLISALLCCLLLTHMLPAHALTHVSDWAEQGIHTAESRALVPPAFRSLSAAAPITRQEFCMVIVNLYTAVTGIQTDVSADDPEIGSGSPFSDTDHPAVIIASYLGLVSGRGSGKFDPHATITRQELCVMLSNMLRIQKDNVSPADRSALQSFPDRRDVSDWAADDMARMVSAGIMSGTTRADGARVLAPLSTATREQSVLLALRYLDTYPPAPALQPEPQPEPDPEPETKPEPQPEPDEVPKPSPALPPAIPPMLDFGALTTEQRMDLVFGSGNSMFEDKETALAAMTEICVPVWRLQEDGTKVSGHAYITVNRALADVYTAVFEEIFAGSERFPIKDAGSFSWRSSTRSEHRQGTAIDLNWNENMECNIDPDTGEVIKITTGSHWLPGEDPYSIPADGDVVRAFKSHGFSWGGDAWTSKRDYMHFSFFGR